MTKSISLILFIFLFSLSALSNPICSSKRPEDNSYKRFLENKEQAIIKFSNTPLIAKLADRTLSQLISAKSKIIMGWLNRRNLTEASPEKIARDWRKYYGENFILGRYPNKDPNVNKAVTELLEGIYGKHLPSSFQKKVTTLFERAKEQSLKAIKNFPIDKKTKSKIIERISQINLYWMTKFKGSKFERQPLELFSWGVAYDPVPNQINIGLDVLQYENDETLFAVFAHEIGHAFDPCRWGAFFVDLKNPFEKVISCLRTEKSVGAKKRDDSKMDGVIKNGRLSRELAMALKQNPTCNKIQYPPVGVQADQAPESFADWFSAEVLAGSNYISKNLRGDLCRTKQLNVGSSYPSHLNRLERIYLAHPIISKALKVKSEAEYCKM